MNHEVAGSSSATGGATGTITFGAGNELTSIVSTGHASLMKQGLAGSPTAESFGIVSVHFDVVGAARAVHIAGTIFARPQDGASAVRTEQARAEIGLRRVNPSNNATLEVMLSAQSWNGDPPPDVTIVLQPGRYQFSTNARVNTGAGCSQCSFTAESAVQATLTFE